MLRIPKAMVYIVVKVVKTDQNRYNLKKGNVKYVKIESRACYMFCRFPVHETLENEYSNTTIIYIYHIIFYCFFHIQSFS